MFCAVGFPQRPPWATKRTRPPPFFAALFTTAGHRQAVPKYFPANLVQYSNTLLKGRMLFGSDYPVITPDRWIADFEKLPIKPEVRPMIMKENARRLLGL